MNTEVVKIDPKQFGLEEQKASQMREGLNPILAEREILSQQYAEVVKMELNDNTLKLARELRLKIRDNRTKGIEQWHKVNKEFYLRGGQFVDAIKKVEIFENERMESNLLEIEKHFENLEKERIANLQSERVAALMPYEVENAESLNLGIMADSVWESFLAGSIVSYNNKKEAERLAKEAEEKRLADEAAERDRIIIENQKLKEEADKAAKALEAERLAAKKILDEQKEKAEAELKKQREEADKAAKIEKDKALKLEAELKAKKDAEIKAQKEKEAADAAAKKEAERLAKAPVKKQLSVWVNSFALPSSNLDNEKAKLIAEKFEAFKAWALKEIESI
jgi:hypothetical protein